MPGQGRRRLYPDYRPKYSGSHPKSVSIVGESIPVRTWKEILLKTCEVVEAKKPTEFHKILRLRGSKRLWFSRKPKELRDPVRIGRTDIFAETNQNANSLVLRSLHVLHLFGLEPKIEIRTEI